jgi:hypothetical protein
MTKFLRISLQVALFASFALFVHHFSSAPRYEYERPELATVKLSLSHGAELVVPCVQFTIEEIAAMPLDDRRPAQCERERLPLTVELEVDGEVVVHIEAAPLGLSKDGPASVYERFTLQPGSHRITARLRDTDRAEGWDYTHTDDVTLEAGRYFTVTFKAETGGFVYR